MAGKVKVTIDKQTLEFKAEIEGMRGGGCTSQLDEFQNMVGMVTEHQTLKPEYKEVRQQIPHRR